MTQSGRPRNWRTGFVEPGLYNIRIRHLGVDEVCQNGKVVIISGSVVDGRSPEVYVPPNAGKSHTG